MRNMIFKTVFTAILGSLLITPLAHADRQGGGTLKVAFKAEPSATEWVRFTAVKDDQVTFEYSWLTDQTNELVEVSTSKAALSGQPAFFIRALAESRNSFDWVRIPAAN